MNLRQRIARWLAPDLAYYMIEVPYQAAIVVLPEGALSWDEEAVNRLTEQLRVATGREATVWVIDRKQPFITKVTERLP